MNKALKRILIVFILLCAAALIVLLAELFIFGDKPAKAPDSSESPSTTGESETPPSTSGTPTETESGTPPPTDTGTETETPSAPVGTQFEIEIPGDSGKNILVYVDESLFAYEDQHVGATFVLKDMSSGTAKIEIGFEMSGDAEALAPSLLENYIPDYKELDTSVEEMGKSGLAGWRVIAKNDIETYEAWLADSSGCVILVVIDYKNTVQRDTLIEVLNTLKVV